MQLDMYQVDAFADEVFEGNPAAVVPLYEWISDELMQRIAAEINLWETAFFVKQGEYYALRWFTPGGEVDLCGHATLAAAHVIYEFLDYPDECIVFETRSGRLFVDREDEDRLSMDFPAWTAKSFQVTERVTRALGVKPNELYSTRDFIAVFDNEDVIRALEPDMKLVAELDGLCTIATAPGKDHDFVSRVFVPSMGIPEDAVTGSAYCSLVPYWAKRLGKSELIAYQASQRGGTVLCRDLGDRIKIAGRAVCFMKAEMFF